MKNLAFSLKWCMVEARVLEYLADQARIEKMCAKDYPKQIGEVKPNEHVWKINFEYMSPDTEYADFFLAAAKSFFTTARVIAATITSHDTNYYIYAGIIDDV